jgi:arylsulfatase A-like enzyme
MSPQNPNWLLWVLILCAWCRVGHSEAASQPVQNQVVVGTGNVAEREHRPNIIFVLADDLGYGDLGCYGQTLIKTPRLDRMASEGVRFTQCYAGDTVCAPSRCCLMTGKHTGHARVRGNDLYPLQPGDMTVAEVLHQAGYHTALIGKWGLGEPHTTGVPNRKGFDEFLGYTNQRHAHNSYPSYLWRNDQKLPLSNIVTNEDQEGAGVASKRVVYSQDLFTQEALAFLEQNAGRPFFLYLAYTLPHANNEAKDHGMEVPDDGPYSSEHWPAQERHKAAMITRLDADVGRVLDKVAQLHLDQDTIVFFSSDNGPHKEGGADPEFFHSSGPLRGIKRDLYEGGIRVPMIVRWPGRIAPSRLSQQVWAFWDFLPTAAELAGAPPPAGIDGISMLPTLLGRQQVNQHQFLYWEFHEGGSKQAIRMGDWKAVRLAPGRPLELYDLQHDLGETRNVAVWHPRILGRIEVCLKGARTPSEVWPLKASASSRR